VAGTVYAAESGKALRRARVILRPAVSGATALGATTDDHGRFEFTRLKPGYYSIAARREGYLAGGVAERGGMRLPVLFPVQPAQTFDGISVRLRPAAVIAGKVRFSDADPAPGVAVQAYGEYYFRGRHGFRPAGRAQTNDHGEYRIYDLPAGNYYVAAQYTHARLPGVEDQIRTDLEGNPLAEERFVTTFHPDSPSLTAAAPLKLTPGLEAANVDIVLARMPTVRITGRIVSGVTGRPIRGATVVLRRPDATNTASIPVVVDAIAEPTGGLALGGVPPGMYHLAVDATEENRRLSARQYLTVGEASLRDLEVVLLPPRELKGVVKIEGASGLRTSFLRVVLEPRTETANVATADVARDGSFTLATIPGEAYDIFVTAPRGLGYLKSARIGSYDAAAEGTPAFGLSLAPLEILFSVKGATVEGRVSLDSSYGAVGATVLLAPDPGRGRLQDFQIASSDEFGFFVFPAVGPGRYLVLSWLDDPPCDYQNPENLEQCRKFAQPVDVAEGGTYAVPVKLSAPAQ
jgi:hypothetical protein